MFADQRKSVKTINNINKANWYWSSIRLFHSTTMDWFWLKCLLDDLRLKSMKSLSATVHITSESSQNGDILHFTAKPRRKCTNWCGWDYYSLPEVFELIKPKLYMPNCPHESNQSGNIHRMEAHNWDHPMNSHVASIIERPLHMHNYKIKHLSC